MLTEIVCENVTPFLLALLNVQIQSFQIQTFSAFGELVTPMLETTKPGTRFFCKLKNCFLGYLLSVYFCRPCIRRKGLFEGSASF